MANFLNASKRAAGAVGSSSLFSKFAPSWLPNASSRCRGIYAHKQMSSQSGMDEERENYKHYKYFKTMFFKGRFGMIGIRAEFVPHRNETFKVVGEMKNSEMMKLWWLKRLRDEKHSEMMKLWWLKRLRDEKQIHDRSEKSGINTRSLVFSEEEERNFRDLDQIVRFRVERNTVFIEGEEENDERRISGRVHLPRHLHVMDGVEGEIRIHVMKRQLYDDDSSSDDDIYDDSSSDDDQSEDPGDGPAQQPEQTTARPEEPTAQQPGETTAQSEHGSHGG